MDTDNIFIYVYMYISSKNPAFGGHILYVFFPEPKPNGHICFLEPSTLWTHISYMYKYILLKPVLGVHTHIIYIISWTPHLVHVDTYIYINYGTYIFWHQHLVDTHIIYIFRFTDLNSHLRDCSITLQNGRLG